MRVAGPVPIGRFRLGEVLKLLGRRVDMIRRQLQFVGQEAFPSAVPADDRLGNGKASVGEPYVLALPQDIARCDGEAKAKLAGVEAEIGQMRDVHLTGLPQPIEKAKHVLASDPVGQRTATKGDGDERRSSGPRHPSR